MEKEKSPLHPSSPSQQASSKKSVCRVYTRQGDAGMTDLADGRRVLKTDDRIACVGVLDELSSQLGLVLSLLPETHLERLKEEAALLLQAQRLLFSVGAWAAAVPHPQGLPLSSDVEALEHAMDQIVSETGSAFRGFVLPGGHPVAAHTHIARTVCRRAERVLLSSDAENWPHGEKSLAYLNRLSDFLFLLAKKINELTGCDENKW